MKHELIYEKLEKFNIKGLGPKTLEYLSLLGINTLFALLYNFPRGYQDRENVKNIEDVEEGDVVSIRGRVLRASVLKLKNGRSIFKAHIGDDTEVIDVSWFQSPYLRGVIKVGQDINLFGKVTFNRGLSMTNPEYYFDDSKNRILPIYSLTKGLSNNGMSKILESAISFSNIFPEIIPEEIIKKYKIMNRQEALREIHFPTSSKKLEDARRRFSIEELLILQFAILSRKNFLEERSYSLENNKELVSKYLKKLPFELTSAQKRVITEIYKEIKDGKVVNRLIQGDVGSGKSVVVFTLLMYLVANNYQGAMMAPTEVVAEQHYLSIKDICEELGVKVVLIKGSMKVKEKRSLLEDISLGRANIVIGTHALLYDKVQFNSLGLVVIDEQHKFGVNQRKLLKDKGHIANTITMSATPIPRSLALTIYGDLDVSIIDELPPGRKAIDSEVIISSTLDILFTKIEKRILNGEQCYIVCPLIDDSEKVSFHSVDSIYTILQKRELKGVNIGIMHGRLKSNEKEEVMSKFKSGEINILVATTVIEVGVDVSNATIMVILNADRFGLAQLHQIRGRVGRGNKQSTCYLVSSTQCDRLDILAETNDGFKIAEEDLKLRKPGEILGMKQSGFSDLRFVDLLKDIKSIKLARDEAISYLKKHKGKIENEMLRWELDKRFHDITVMN